MANFCTNCGNRLGKDDKFCTNCGTKIEKEDRICTRCGNRLEKEDKFCTNCGTPADIRNNYHSSKSMPDRHEIKKAKKELKRVIGGRLIYSKNFVKATLERGLGDAESRSAISHQLIEEIESGRITSSEVEARVYQVMDEYQIRMENERQEEMERVKLIDEILESEEIRSQIIKHQNSTASISSVKNNLKEKLISKKEIRSEDEIRDFIKSELVKLREEERKASFAKQARTSSAGSAGERKMSANTRKTGGYCDSSCRHYLEEYMDRTGEITYDLSCETIMIDYYCNLGHYTTPGSFCKYYEK